jgi:DNA-binding transcriptional LysR family regulator
MLVADELARGELVVACARPLSGERNYYLVTPERADQRPLLKFFSDWLLAQARQG